MQDALQDAVVSVPFIRVFHVCALLDIELIKLFAALGVLSIRLSYF